MSSSDSDETTCALARRLRCGRAPDLDDIIAQCETALRVYDDTRAARTRRPSTPTATPLPVRGGGPAAGVAPYAPFADDTRFDGRVYLTKFREFVWQTNMRDLQIVEYDTARRV
ncbi:hypothetical protein HYPSUDRAFT_207655 [Hypholoma sublateritium FD-334 SS-4]|uniref:Uncharacterized protein n=1 Tax=Hypholoma sublateritium (strain FD-334 SS-4) TaxID=945553 RepID=A0A0D2NGF8_HYPSF|nr:hypothetical protein HYPSUDRAFT_207655 [Hypholoma sublateritium FD-334 SS-4]